MSFEEDIGNMVNSPIEMNSTTSGVLKSSVLKLHGEANTTAIGSGIQLVRNEQADSPLFVKKSQVRTNTNNAICT